MKSLKKILFFLLCFTPIMVQAQIIDNPVFDSKNSSSVTIMKIEITDSNTIVYFIYKAPDKYINGGWFNINPSIYIKDANGNLSYKLIKAEGVPLAPDVKKCDYIGQILSFKLIFPKIDSYVNKINIIECNADNCFNFYGISLKNSNNSSTTSKKSDKFRIDYTLICFYDSQNQKWLDWSNSDNTFVMNINERGDVAHYKANGKTEIYKKVSGTFDGTTNDGDQYQSIKVLDENGDTFILSLYDNPSLGLVIMSGKEKVQFANP